MLESSKAYVSNVLTRDLPDVFHYWKRENEPSMAENYARYDEHDSFLSEEEMEQSDCRQLAIKSTYLQINKQRLLVKIPSICFLVVHMSHY
jgi:hypothetical protein